VVKERVRWSSPFGLCTRLLSEEALSFCGFSSSLSCLSGFLEATSRRSPQQLGNWHIVLFLELRVGELLSLGVVGSLLQKCRGLRVEKK